MAAKKTLYEILGVAPDANDLDIGLAFQRRSLEMQRTSGADSNALTFITHARDTLADPRRRAAYDATLVTASEKAAAASQAPDLVVETDADEEEESGAKKTVIPIVGVGVMIALAIFIWAKTGHSPEPAKPDEAEAPPPQAAPPPPPPKAMKGEEILAASLNSLGRVQSFDMSGKAAPIGLALAGVAGAIESPQHGEGSAERRVGTAGRIGCRSRWPPATECPPARRSWSRSARRRSRRPSRSPTRSSTSASSPSRGWRRNRSPSPPTKPGPTTRSTRSAPTPKANSRSPTGP
jgi:curved DNA-binding protein CbpA